MPRPTLLLAALAAALLGAAVAASPLTIELAEREVK